MSRAGRAGKKGNPMLRALQSLKGVSVQAIDGQVGRVEDFLFDDRKWTIRYLVVGTGGWPLRNKVLISPIAARSAPEKAGAIEVSLTRDQVKNSPNIDTDKPVSRQMEAQYHDYYRWPYYWTGTGVWGVAPYPAGMLGRPYAIPPSEPPPGAMQPPREEGGDPHLRSSGAVRGYRIEAGGSRFGHVEDYIIDTESWTIRYLVVDTRNFWPSKSVLISPDWVGAVDWADRKVAVALTEAEIKNSPEFIPEAPVNRAYEERLYDYYGRPSYWSEGPAGFEAAARSPGRHVV